MANASLADEARALQEFLELRGDAVYRGIGVPHGDGRLVLVLPGLFGTDLYLHPLRDWLRRIGYAPAMSMIGLNAGCPDRLLRRVEAPFLRRLQRQQGDVAIIGHSRGGMLGKALATRLGDRCARFIAVGSPVGALLRAGRQGLLDMAAGQSSAARPVAAQAVVDAGRAAMRLFDPDCKSPHCDCGYISDLLAPLPAATRAFSIYTTDDPVVGPDSCPIDGATNIAVRGTHSGLVVNKAVYPHIAAALA